MKGGKCLSLGGFISCFQKQAGEMVGKGSRTWSMDVCAGWDSTTYRIVSFSTSNELPQMSFSLLPNWG